MRQAGYLDKYSSIREAVDQEDLAHAKILGDLRELNIETVDLLPELERQVSDRDLFPPTDPHPNKAGYSVIAGTLNSYLNTAH